MASTAQRQESSSIGHGRSLQRRVVAASFLFRKQVRLSQYHAKDGQLSGSSTSSEVKLQVALFRRSGKVRTYQYKLAPVSGSMDEEDHGDAKATAIREIREETTLEHGRDFDLLLAGKPYSFTDEAISRQWIIHPFSWLLKDAEDGLGTTMGEQSIKIDWEHEGWEWYDPLDVNDSDDFGGVPKLLDSLRRVWPACDLGIDASGKLLQGIKQLREDHENGARQLATHAVHVLGSTIKSMDCETVDQQWFQKVRIAAWHICHNGRPSMGSAITSAILAALGVMEPIVMQASLDSRGKLTKILTAVDEQITNRSTTAQRIQHNFEEYTKQILQQKPEQPSRFISILTLSLSSTITNCLIGATKNLGVHLDIRILESRPRFEGLTCASKLLEAAEAVFGTKTQDASPLNIRIYTDAAAAYGAHGVDMILLGSDRISTLGDVSNKIGSLPAVLCAREVSPAAKIIILSETDKVASPGETSDHLVEKNDPNELIDAWKNSGSVFKTANKLFGVKQQLSGSTGSTIEVENIYFEWVPARFVDIYITEQGQWNAEDIRSRSAWIGDEEARFFGDL